MNRVRELLAGAPEQQYEPVDEDASETDRLQPGKHVDAFSWISYFIFMLLGIAMLWTWNMFLAANPYFQRRYADNPWILKNFQSIFLCAATLANMGTMLVLAKKQVNASYPKRIIASLFLSMTCFMLLALSAVLTDGASPGVYLAFVIFIVFVANTGSGLIQNGVFAYVQGFSQSSYTQAIMVGQGVAGVLPCIAQIVSVQAVNVESPMEKSPGARSSDEHRTAKAALSYFLVAVGVSSITLLAFLFLRRRKPAALALMTDHDTPQQRPVAMLTLFSKLRWHSIAIFFSFALTMLFPVYTQAITSVRPPNRTPPLLQKDSFIPLGLLMWNIGDLSGRLITAVPFFSRPQYPKLILTMSICRILFIPLYHLCNLDGKGAVVNSDAFYLFVVQLGFGLSNGWVGSTCMMAPKFYVNDREKEVAGAYMGLMLVAGLSVGSFLSFLAGGS
ncbi:MAG: hypothetical protein M1814_002477 [Vezdaea aestivalis]|nr:MAG: hypothetical protein M1814_002477 [Vezdaea aestivalis]